MSKKKVTKNDREKLFDRTISKGENSGHSLGQTIGHAFAFSGGYITGSDITKLSNISTLEELSRTGFIERHEKLNTLTKSDKDAMSSKDLKTYDRDNTVYVATQKLTKLYKEKVDSKVIFAKGNSVKHGLIQRAVYMSADRDTRQTFLNEKDLEKMYKLKVEELRETSQNRDVLQSIRLEALDRLERMNEMRQDSSIQLVDFAYTQNGELCFGEAVTGNYTQADLDAKAAFVEALGYSSESLAFYK